MNKHGINFDIGLPLTKQEDFDLFYVDWLPEQTQRLNDWLNDPNSNSIIVTGQIGCGKTTFIQNALQKSQNQPDLTLRLDEIFYISEGSFWSVFLFELLSFAQKSGIDLSVFGFHIFYDEKIHSHSDFIEILKPNINLEVVKRQENIIKNIDNNIHLLQPTLSSLCKEIENKLNRKLFVYAESVDKFNIHTADYKLVNSLLLFLKKYKTLYETNLVHVFCEDVWREDSEQIILTTASEKIVKDMCKKRLGIYSVDFKTEIPKLSKLSGGNFRQALRLLVSFEFAIRKIEKTKAKAIKYAEKIVRQDLLSIHSSDIVLLKAINQSCSIKDSTVIYEKGANNALFGNQIFITSEKDEQNNWKAIVNPLLNEVLEKYKGSVKEDTEIERYTEIAKFELKHVFNSLASYFLNKGKNEIIVITHNDIEVAKITNDYLVGRAGAYDELLYNEIDLKNDNILELIHENEQNNFDGTSYFFLERLNENNTNLLEINRNRLISKNMMWWIYEKNCNEYINKWFHLRQFMRFFSLESNILNAIQTDDIVQDIEDLEILDYNESDRLNIKNRLEKVLNYVNDRKNG